MPDAKGRLLVVSDDLGFRDGFAVHAKNRGFEAVFAAEPREASRAGAGPFAAVLVDLERLPPGERLTCPALGSMAAPVFLLETARSIAPDAPAPLRRLAWPPPAGFARQIRAADRPVVLLADQTLYATGAVRSLLDASDVDSVCLEAAVGLGQFLRESEDLGRVLVARFTGSEAEAEAVDRGVRNAVPEAVCYLVSSADPMRAAEAAVKGARTVSLMRSAAPRIPDLLAGDGTAVPGRRGGRILLVDNFKPTLAASGQALLAAGYEVFPAQSAEEALQGFQAGAFHLAVIGTAIAYAQQTGAQFAAKLRERDPDLRIIFMVDRYPLQAALQGVSQVVELGLDDALLKPVEPSRLIFSVQRALERRFLLLENARLLKEITESNRQLAQINEFQKKFFAMVAHDVKNPLTAILGYAEILGMLMKDRPADGKCAGHIHSAAKTLNTLISDLVDLAAIESGKLRVEIGALDLLAVIGEVRSRIEIVAGQRKITFDVDVPAALPPLAGDPARLGQVIQNLCT
ncbi:MAG: hybrid sensor histidine kinase/response regulator, partial [Elusimicrobia bacterium]|nr:hybrid sensor histidine kinase/response regulator [Elusimicrobiota bacterium]